MKTLKVKDLMLSLSDYAVVPMGATLLEAIRALDEAQKSVFPQRHRHRAVLVSDARGEIVGKLDHLAFLRALLPERGAFLDEDTLERAGVTDDMQSISEGMFDFLGEALLDVATRARNVTVGDFLTPAKVSVEPEASLYDAIKAFLQNEELSLLVRKGGVIIGILRLSDLFDELARQARQNDSGGSPE